MMKNQIVLITALAMMAANAQETVVREYSQTVEVPAGEVVVREVEAFPPAPYVATSPLAISFAPKFEFPCETWDVAGIRLNLLVGSHRGVYALDFGGIGNFADYKMDGIGVGGFFNSVGESDGAILIAGLFNFVAFDFSGCQVSGLYSCTEGKHFGLQIAVANYAGSLTGMQIGVFNYADTLCGIQLGAFNFNSSSPISFLPVVNASF